MERKIPRHKKDLIDLIINRLKQKNNISNINLEQINYVKNYVMSNYMDVNHVT